MPQGCWIVQQLVVRHQALAVCGILFRLHGVLPTVSLAGQSDRFKENGRLLVNVQTMGAL
eukprot:4183336-Amphidinium_carterae.1